MNGRTKKYGDELSEHTFFFGAIRAEFYGLFVFMTFYWWHRQLLRMKLLVKNVSPDGKSHTWKIIKRFQLIGCMNQLPCCQLIGISFLHNEIHFFTISSLPCTRLFQCFRVGFTSMLRQCTVTVWAVFVAADAAVFVHSRSW